MKILIADRISPIGVDLFKAESGFEVVEAYGSSPEKVLELVKDVDAIALRSDTRVTAEVIAAAPKLLSPDKKLSSTTQAPILQSKPISDIYAPW